MLREVGAKASMDAAVAHFQARTLGIFEFWVDEFSWTELMLQQLKTNLGEAEAEILRTHEASFKKALYQVKLFLKDVDISFFDVDKDVDHQGELVNEA
ncbi:hypothetical protein JHK82_027577 [Glycine max]|nr:hypothetical protein JHK86_012339 [Glycine max]KAG5126742.1 hypothetical protein JHK82_027577 [Glycine max]